MLPPRSPVRRVPVRRPVRSSIRVVAVRWCIVGSIPIPWSCPAGGSVESPASASTVKPAWSLPGRQVAEGSSARPSACPTASTSHPTVPHTGLGRDMSHYYISFSLRTACQKTLDLRNIYIVMKHSPPRVTAGTASLRELEGKVRASGRRLLRPPAAATVSAANAAGCNLRSGADALPLRALPLCAASTAPPASSRGGAGDARELPRHAGTRA